MTTRGYFVETKTGFRYPFMCNPESIEDSKTVTYAQQTLPAQALPIYQYATGGPRTISFELILDGDLALRNREASAVLNTLRTALPKGTRTIQPDLDYLRSLLYPSSASSSIFAEVEPPVILFSLGAHYQGLACLLTSAPATIEQWSPTMVPMRGRVAITLEEFGTNLQDRSRVFMGGRP